MKSKEEKSMQVFEKPERLSLSETVNIKGGQKTELEEDSCGDFDCNPFTCGGFDCESYGA